jgi:hypothetical protein
MGKYINELPDGTMLRAKNKVTDLLTIDGAKQIDSPKEWEENLVCVVDNEIFDAAAYAYDEREMKRFLQSDGRPKQWMIIPHAQKLAK